MKIEETRFEYFHETQSGFSGLFATAYKQFNPLQNIPPKDSFRFQAANPYKLLKYRCGFALLILKNSWSQIFFAAVWEALSYS
jgi:hypothetical protein